ncbi:hypothetical protein GW15_0222185 [Xanthomonas axonopodis pv. vasculorum]|uniref:Uncharacterized protein n=1 Tax=Xanthomonas axonopodis pv. vasculorum TaxID=325777 RepID=A0A098PUF7_9XANT|nr:hypothetical protein GW15_0222185 [Xanthomonas axonopodis pv. vasculorum]
MQHPVPKLLYQLFDELPLLGKQVSFIDIAPVPLVQGERFFLLDEIVIASIPSDQLELGVVREAKLHGALINQRIRI